MTALYTDENISAAGSGSGQLAEAPDGLLQVIGEARSGIGLSQGYTSVDELVNYPA